MKGVTHRASHHGVAPAATDFVPRPCYRSDLVCSVVVVTEKAQALLDEAWKAKTKATSAASVRADGYQAAFPGANRVGARLDSRGSASQNHTRGLPACHGVDWPSGSERVGVGESVLVSAARASVSGAADGVAGGSGGKETSVMERSKTTARS